MKLREAIDERMSRRQFLNRLILSLSGLAAAVVGVPIVAYLFSPLLNQEHEWRAVGAVVVALAVFLGPKELNTQADPTNVNAYPRPDWYFLSYFALLSLIPPGIEDWVIIGFPLLAVILLFAVPFISNKGERSPSRRPWTIAIVGVIAVALIVLVQVGDDAPWSPNLNPGPLPVAVTQNLSPAQSDGADPFHSSGCVNCHLVDGVGGKRGPNLTTISDRLDRDQMIWRILNGGENMPAYGRSLKPDDLSDLVDFMQTLQR